MTRYNMQEHVPIYTQSEMERYYPSAYPVGEYYCRGYVSRRLADGELPAEPYSGRHGNGYVVYSPCFTSTQYCYITYYIVEE